MDFINKTANQLLDLFRTMSPGMRITAGLLLVLIVTSLVYLFIFQVHSGTDYLFGAREFSREELDAMEKAFGDAGLNDYEMAGQRIRVPRRKRHEYLQALTQSEFTPENFDSAIDAVLSSNGHWFESRQLRELKFRHATQKKLSRVISAMAGIERATVQFHSERTGGYPPKVEKSVTVAVAADGRRSLDRRLVRAIRTTASGWFGIDRERVVVTDLIGGGVYDGVNGGDEHGAADRTYHDTKDLYEQMWQRKIYDRLAMYEGVVVAVNVQLENEMDNQTQKVTYDPQPTSVESTSESKTTESQSLPGGRPGAVPNKVPSNSPRELAGTSTPTGTSSEESRESQVLVAGHEQTLSKRAPLPPKQVYASIGVPRSYFEKVWHQRSSAAAGKQPAEPNSADLDNVEQTVKNEIKDAVVNLLPPVPAGKDPYPQVQVTTYEDMPPETIEEPGMATMAAFWLSENWQTLALFALGFGSLLMLRSMVRAAAPQAEAAAASAAGPVATAAESTTEDELDEEVASILPRRDRTGGPSLQEELANLVKEAPDAAANVLRTWIGDSA